MSKAIVATLRAKPGRRAELLQAFKVAVLPEVEKETGTQAYLMHAGSNADEIVFYELYSDDAAVQEHGRNMGKWFGAVKDLAASAPVIQVLDPQGGFARFPPPTVAEVTIGARLPDATFYTIGADGAPATLTTADVFGGKTVALFAVPGPFTPGCTQRHLPGYARELAAFKSKGVDTVACLAVSDPFVMQAWKERENVPQELLMLADTGAFAAALGIARDMSGFGLGVRSQRFSMIVKDGIVKSLDIDRDGRVKHSSAAQLLAKL